jgi:hypothetical protein
MKGLAILVNNFFADNHFQIGMTAKIVGSQQVSGHKKEQIGKRNA